MDVIIYTSDPEKVTPEAVRSALEGAGFFVRLVDVRDRGGLE